MSKKKDSEKSKSGLKRIEKISDHILLVEYETQEQLCKALLRPEEHYESPEFKDRIFTLGQFREWYSRRFGAWTYYSDWSGFNIPGHIFRPFIDGLFDPLGPAEMEIVDLVRYKKDRFCLIGTYEGSSPDIYEHEICHALFATSDGYKSEVLRLLKPYPLKELKKILKDDYGYADSVILDECHAYISESSEWLDEKEIPYPSELKIALRKLKRKYLK